MVKIENPKDNLLDAINGKDVDVTPAASLTQTGIVDLMDETGAYWPEANKKADLMTKLSLAGHEIIGFDSVRVPWGLTVQAEVLGCEIDFGKKDQQPSPATHPLENDPAGGAIPDDFLERGRIPTVLESISNLDEKVGDDVAVIGGLAGPATLAGHLVGTENYMKWYLTDPENVDAIHETSTEACIKYAKAMIEAGADIIAPADPVAGPELLSPDMFRNKVKGKHQKFTNEIGEASTVLHICGDTTPILDEMADCGYDAVSIEAKVDLTEAKEILDPTNTPIVGTISTTQSLLSGTPEDVKEEVIENIEKGTSIVAPGCGIAPSSPLENVKALVEARNEYFDLDK